jgi:hypothetical protein
MAVTPKQGTELMTYFAKLTGTRFNRATAKWAARELIESYGLDTCRQAVLWYTKTAKQAKRVPDWNHFVRVADECVKASEAYYRDIEHRKELKASANEWRKL